MLQHEFLHLAEYLLHQPHHLLQPHLVACLEERGGLYLGVQLGAESVVAGVEGGVDDWHSLEEVVIDDGLHEGGQGLQVAFDFGVALSAQTCVELGLQEDLAHQDLGEQEKRHYHLLFVSSHGVHTAIAVDVEPGHLVLGKRSIGHEGPLFSEVRQELSQGLWELLLVHYPIEDVLEEPFDSHLQLKQLSLLVPAQSLGLALGQVLDAQVQVLLIHHLKL